MTVQISGMMRAVMRSSLAASERTTRAPMVALNHLPHDLDFRAVKMRLPLGVLGRRDDLLAWRVNATRGETQLKTPAPRRPLRSVAANNGLVDYLLQILRRDRAKVGLKGFASLRPRQLTKSISCSLSWRR